VAAPRISRQFLTATSLIRLSDGRISNAHVASVWRKEETEFAGNHRRSDPKDRNSKNIREDSVSGTFAIAITITDVTRIVVFLPPAACRCRYDTLPSHRP